ncbi:MAG: hypothetical protein RSD77_09525 [Romboutsia sp.]
MKYKYGLNIRDMVNQITSEIEGSGIIISRKYIDNFNICPSCKTEIKTYRNEVVGVGSISLFIPNESKNAIIYCLCKGCATNINKITGYMNKTQDLDCEEFINGKLEELEISK